MSTRRFFGAICLALCGFASSAFAQVVDENVVTQSDDAFGRSVGNQNSGLYEPGNVRGFSAVDAGNVRLEGLYFDLINRLPLQLIDGSTIRVGLASQGHPFPAPTGLADYRLALPGDVRVVSLTASTAGNSARGPGGRMEFQLPLSNGRLGLSGGIGGRRSTRPEGGTHSIVNYGIISTFKPGGDAEIVAFTGGIIRLSAESRVTYFPAGDSLPPKVKRGMFLGQKWTGQDRRNFAHGGLVRLPIGGLKLETGLFYSRQTFEIDYADLLIGVDSDGNAARRVFLAEPDQLDDSLSGEFRLSRQWSSGRLDHSLTASIRGRKKHRRFGGGDRISLDVNDGETLKVLEPDFRPEPAFDFAPTNTDDVRQLTAGLAYSLVWNDRASLDVGISKSRYRKRVDFASPLIADPVTRDRPLLWNVAASFDLTKAVTIYGGLTRGQEEALIAPSVAANQSEAPPAIRTKQVEAGVAIRIADNLSFVGGVFEISKPYFNLDPADFYRRLGTLTNRGIELSLAGSVAPGFSVIAGTVLLDPRIEGEAVQTGLIGRRPIGQARRRSVLNLDWRMQDGEGPVSFDVAVESVSSRTADRQNTLRAPGYTTFNIGARYRIDIASVSVVIRPQIRNLFNTYGWQVSSSGGFSYNNRRMARIELAADFY